MFTSTPVSTDSKILEHFDQMRTLILGFLQQKSDKQLFFDYVASEAEKMTQEEFEDLKGRIFRDIETIKSNRRCQPLPRRSATVTTESQRVGILPTTTQQVSSSTQAAASSSYVYYTPSPIGFGNPTSVLTLQDDGSRHNLSGILSQLPDLKSTQIIDQLQQQQPQLFTITTSTAAASSVAIQSGLVFDLPGPFKGHPNIPKTINKLQVAQIPLPKHNSSVQILITRKKKRPPPNMKQITHGTTHNEKRPHRKKLK